jgi:2-C-methyl-D-erythritol 2,4-cyclodiphosphate synthase
MQNKIRVGLGYDVHSLITGRQLVLGGVSIPYTKGLSGWSDADALVHAIIDALLGAAALGDIGTHFPPGNQEYRNISSLTLLGKVKELLDINHWKVGNVDAMIMLEEPKLKDYKNNMAQNIARMLDIQTSQVSIKAGTNEKMGFVGRGEGIAVQAVALIEATGE